MINVRNVALAKSHIARLLAQPDRPLAIFTRNSSASPFSMADQVGDLIQEAQRQGLMPICMALDPEIYPLHTINQALEAAMAKVNALMENVMGGDAVCEALSRDLPVDPAFRMDALLKRLSGSGAKILLVLDEFQLLSNHQDGDDMTGAIRAAIAKRSGAVYAVFTGCDSGFLKAFSMPGEPMYQFAEFVHIQL